MLLGLVLWVILGLRMEAKIILKTVTNSEPKTSSEDGLESCWSRASLRLEGVLEAWKADFAPGTGFCTGTCTGTGVCTGIVQVRVPVHVYALKKDLDVLQYHS